MAGGTAPGPYALRVVAFLDELARLDAAVFELTQALRFEFGSWLDVLAGAVLGAVVGAVVVRLVCLLAPGRGSARESAGKVYASA